MTTTTDTSDLTVNDVCRRLAISRPTAYKMIHTGAIRAYKIGRATRVTRESLDEFRRAAAVGGVA